MKKTTRPAIVSITSKEGLIGITIDDPVYGKNSMHRMDPFVLAELHAGGWDHQIGQACREAFSWLIEQRARKVQQCTAELQASTDELLAAQDSLPEIPEGE